MATGRKRKRSVRVSGPGNDGFDDPEVEKLTERYLELRRNAFRSAVDSVIEQGEIILAVERRVQGGLSAWLERVGTGRTTAYNHAALARLAREQPEIIQRWKELGPSKLYKIAKLPQPARRKVLRPADEQRLQLANEEEFAEIVAPHVRTKRPVTATQRAHGFRMRVRAWGKWVRAVKVDGIDDELRAGLAREIDELFKWLRQVRKELR